ncbi:cytochrome P450 [Trametes versicolor FP-101664 SS1]|uniref:cytochrome P450 n=1 Tax=Trametes versicolor (strain FP-101664) TaxID=717944 RepID=UPI0004621AB4|nr:cytochrome P450 [Trametes versicolor FP-101664 SS1]EIW55755.1 cytochrome P450 [Trametes versicolor FP-101664 SS1]
MPSSAVVLTLIAIFSALWFASIGRRRRNLPPGPKPKPLIGNLFDFTLKELWVRATEWAEQYGDMVYVQIFGQGVLFINSYTAAVDLFEKKGTLYADRPHMVMAAELCGCENIIAFAGLGDGFRRHRKMMQSALSASSIPSYRPLVVAETYPFLRRMMESPQNYMTHLRRYVGAQTLSIVYGYRMTEADDLFLRLAEQTQDMLSNDIASGGTGMWMVDILPFLKHLPSWFPGAGFQTKAADWKAKIEYAADAPFNWTKANMETGNASTCYCTLAMDNEGDDSVDKKRESDVKWTALTMYMSSIDTTLVVMSHFILAMVKYPAVLKKAQSEIDALTGGSRLPNHDDRAALPYVEAVVSECLRWSVPVPLGLAHRLMEDDVYEDKFIPKGTFVFTNIWRMTRDATQFASPDEFVPERFLEGGQDGPSSKRYDPNVFVFGFGRRRCPGTHLADSTLWIAIACMLATLDFGKAIDASGEPIEPQPEYNNSTFRSLDPFPCKIVPRSEHTARLVQDVAAVSI